ncbi:MAG: hypothetical protein A2231_08370 [Candidatus Firestonebacteria bacterium RIFOXYA2_FULL_40_8]|nr:MAG: hypothetical protein A2231_08370 [Candidatus Firestonebacteria bacterium RIFOXYA2_FULL_40_8]
MINSLFKSSKEIVNIPAKGLKNLLSSVKGNAKVLIVTYPGFSIPTAWIGVYQSLFILSLGVSNIEYGKLLGLGIGVQILSQLLGGVLADRLGHKKVLDIFTLGWPISLVLLAFAQNIWLVIPAIIFFNLLFVSTPSWNCLFIEGIPKNKRSDIYAVVHMLLNGGALVLPIAGFFVKLYGIDIGSRIIFLTAAVMTCISIYYRWTHLKETKLGEKIVSENKSINIRTESRDFKKAFRLLMENRKIFWYILVNIIFVLAITMWGAFNSIFLADPKEVGLEPSSLAVFPLVSSMIFIIAVIIFVPQIKKNNYIKYIGYGILLNAAASTFYIFAPAKNMSLIVLSYMIYGAGLAMFRPLYDARLMNIFKEKDRARLLSVFNTIVLVASLPGGLLSGYLYTLYPRSLYIATTALFLLAFLILWKKVKQ